MRRLKFFRVLLPATLVVFVVLLALAYRQRPPVHLTTLRDTDTSRRAENLEHTTYEGDRPTLQFEVDRAEETVDGKLHLEAVKRLEIPRDGRQPLIVTADRGDIEGQAGRRMMHFRSGVVITDPEDGLVLSIPVLEVDELAGEARSLSEVRVEGSKLNGRAESLVYGLAGQPSELLRIELHNAEGASLKAKRAVLHDGLDDVELIGEVEALRRAEEHFHAGTLRMTRGPERRIRRAKGAKGVDGSVLLPGGGVLGLQSESVEVLWDAAGEPERLMLQGGAELRQGAGSLAAASIVAERGSAASADWSVQAEGTVYLQGLVAGGPAWLRAERLEGKLDSAWDLRSASVFGEVRFDGPEIRAEADEAKLTRHAATMRIQLDASGQRKARLARGRTRVAAERIVTDDRGEGLLAERSVEATLLPAATRDGSGGVPGLFDVDRAVHFVAGKLEGSDFARRLSFSERVRAWQGEQNLSAEQVILDQSGGTLTAIRNVTTRVPRDRGGSLASEADFVQINAARLDYDERGRQAAFEGEVRVRLAEGWMEAAAMDVDFVDGKAGIREIRAEGQVRVEFHDPTEGVGPKLIIGHADRLVYRPAEATVWLHGDATPASVRRIGEGGVTTSGRILRYQLELGTLEVDSEGRIHTAG